MIIDHPDAAAPFYERRRTALQQVVADAPYEALLITHLPNIRYLSGFSGTSASLLITATEVTFLTDFRYADQSDSEVKGDVNKIIYREPMESIGELLRTAGAKKTGFEAEHVSAAKAVQIKEKFGPVAPTMGIVEKLRLYKDAMEVETIQALVTILEQVYADVPSLITPGVRERDVAVELEYRLRKGGGDGAAFDFIVASGPRSALPHGVASSRVIGANEPVTLDWGVKGFGYHTDNTRTIATGAVEEEMARLYDITLAANKAAIDAVRPGVTVRQIDDAARNLITGEGYGEWFGHGTGHGVGLDIHEKPTLSWRDETVVEEGMIFTIEPGIYLPGKYGVRIEDMVLVTGEGNVVLTDGIAKEERLERRA